MSHQTFSLISVLSVHTIALIPRVKAVRESQNTKATVGILLAWRGRFYQYHQGKEIRAKLTRICAGSAINGRKEQMSEIGPSSG